MVFGKPYVTCHEQESRHTKILGNAFSEYSILVQLETRSTKRTAMLSNKIKRMHEDQGSALSEGKRDSKTACCS